MDKRRHDCRRGRSSVRATFVIETYPLPVALNCGIGSSSLDALVNALERLHMVRAESVLWKRLVEEKLTGLSDTAAPGLEHAVATFGSPGKDLDWLNSEYGALQNRIPVELLRENQVELVDEELRGILRVKREHNDNTHTKAGRTLESG